MKRYEQFPHTADIGVRAFGHDMRELFENAAFAVFDIASDLEGLKCDTEEVFRLAADNSEELLVAWLDELLFRFYTRHIIYSRFEITELTDKALKAKVFGRAIGANRSRLKTEIKAATYSDLKIMKSEGGYSAEVILDV